MELLDKRREYEEKYHVKRIDEVVEMFKEFKNLKYIGKKRRPFRILLQNWAIPNEFGRLAIVGDEIHIFNLDVRTIPTPLTDTEEDDVPYYTYVLLCKGKIAIGGRGYVDERIRYKEALAVAHTNSYNKKLRSMKKILDYAKIDLLHDTNYILDTLLAEDGEKVVRFNRKGKVEKEYITDLDFSLFG